MKRTTTKKEIMIFEEKEVRRTWHDEQWYFAINDVVEILTQTPNVSDYVKKMRLRDPELSKGWGQIVTPLSIKTKGGMQKINCSSLQGVFRIIQSIPSPKAEPFKLWLAKVGQERIEEIQDPERAILRAKKIYEHKGYDSSWVSKHMKGINVRNTLTDEWKARETKERKFLNKKPTLVDFLLRTIYFDLLRQKPSLILNEIQKKEFLLKQSCP